MMIFFLLIISNFIKSAYVIPTTLSNQLYVVPFRIFRNDNADGSIKYPYTSIQQALNNIDTKYRITINLYPTYHFVEDTIRLTEIHSHIQLTTMTDEITALYEELVINDPNYHRLSRASISGGIPITNWTSTGGNIYKATITQPIFVNQLFINNQRIIRTRLPMNQSEYFQYAAPLQDPNEARYGFQYDRGQFETWPVDDTMVVVYHSWTTSHHYIDKIDTTNRTIRFTNPSNSPIGTYVIQGQRRFHVENLCLSFVPNSFCFIHSIKTIYLMTDGTYDPTKVQIITPVHEFVVILASTDVNNPVTDIIIDNVAIQHSAWNIGRTEQADYQAASFLTSATVYMENATRILMSNIEISHTGSYGIWIKEGTTNVNLMNSLITDTGAGGIRIGQMIAPVINPTSSIHIISNEISYGGNVFPSGVGLLIHRATDVIAADNSIHHQRYTGVSVGWEWGYNPSYTNNILIHRNYIYNTGQHILCDQGGIYTLGIQPGTIITNNVIKNVFSYVAYMWGIYLDEGSSEIVVSNNIVYNIGWAGLFQHYGANNTIINNIFARTSLISPLQPDDPIPDGDLRIMLTENHLSWTFTNNIVYDTYQGSNHSMFKSDYSNVSVSFNNNIYYNPYKTLLLFGIEQISFEQWQKTGQDNNSLIADPLFLGDVNQCDFFTIQFNSPAAKLGFKNITKLSKWTSGCEEDDFDDSSNQFYHW